MTTNGQPSLSPGKGAVDIETAARRWWGGRGRRPMAIREDPSGNPSRQTGRGARHIAVLLVVLVAIVLALVLVLAVGPLIAHSPAPHH